MNETIHPSIGLQTAIKVAVETFRAAPQGDDVHAIPFIGDERHLIVHLESPLPGLHLRLEAEIGLTGEPFAPTVEAVQPDGTQYSYEIPLRTSRWDEHPRWGDEIVGDLVHEALDVWQKRLSENGGRR